MVYSPESAALIFTASTVVLVVSLMLLSSTWKTLQEIQNALPVRRRKLTLLTRKIQDERKRHKEVLKNLLYFGSFLLGLNIFLNGASLICIAGTVVGIHFGQYGLENFNGARYMLFVSPMVLFAAIICIGAHRFDEFLDMKKGKLTPSRFLTGRS